jgi:hypothetical protein
MEVQHEANRETSAQQGIVLTRRMLEQRLFSFGPAGFAFSGNHHIL